MKMKLEVLLFLFFSSVRISSATVSALFVFGDSWFDAGNNKYLNSTSNLASGDLPYGETYFGFPTGRYSDGRTIPDFIAQGLGLPLTPPVLMPSANFNYGANFASGGSNMFGRPKGSISIADQLNQFHDLIEYYKTFLGESETASLVNSSLVLICIGSNDVHNYVINATLRTMFTRQAYIEHLLTRYRIVIERLHNAGARRLVVVGLGPLGCTPAGRLAASKSSMGRLYTGCLDSANQLAMGFNTGLRSIIVSMNQRLSDQLVIVFAKPYDLMMQAITNPFHHGFSDCSSACCGRGPFRAAVLCSEQTLLCLNPSKHLYWDMVHLTETGYSFLFINFWEGDSKYVEPYNIYKLTQTPA